MDAQPIYYTKRDTLKNVPPWTKLGEDGMKQAQVIPTDHGLQVTLFDENVDTVDCFVPYDLIVAQVALGAAEAAEKAEAADAEKAESEAAAEAVAGANAQAAAETGAQETADAEAAAAEETATSEAKK